MLHNELVFKNVVEITGEYPLVRNEARLDSPEGINERDNFNVNFQNNNQASNSSAQVGLRISE